jgi:hypothetical protein
MTLHPYCNANMGANVKKMCKSFYLFSNFVKTIQIAAIDGNMLYDKSTKLQQFLL